MTKPFTPAATPPAVPAVTPPPVVPAPLSLESLTLPEGFTMDPVFGAELVTLINEKAATPAELVQGLIDLQIKATTKASETDSQNWDAVQAEWKKAGETDPVVGGANYQATVASAKMIADRFGGPAFTAALELTGMGNHPQWLHLASKLAPFIGEAAPVITPLPKPPATGTSSTNLYPEQGAK